MLRLVKLVKVQIFYKLEKTQLLVVVVVIVAVVVVEVVVVSLWLYFFSFEVNLIFFLFYPEVVQGCWGIAEQSKCL